MRLKETEHQIQSAIMDYLKAKKIFHWRNNSGAMLKTYKDKTFMVRFGAVGSPDIFVLKNGKLYGIEVKSATGKMRPEQILFGAMIEENGGIFFVARSVDEVAKYL